MGGADAAFAILGTGESRSRLSSAERDGRVCLWGLLEHLEHVRKNQMLKNPRMHHTYERREVRF